MQYLTTLSCLVLATGLATATPLFGKEAQAPVMLPKTAPVPNHRRFCDYPSTLDVLVTRPHRWDTIPHGIEKREDDSGKTLVANCEVQFVVVLQQLWTRSGEEWIYICDAGEKESWDGVVREVREREASCGRHCD